MALKQITVMLFWIAAQAAAQQPESKTMLRQGTQSEKSAPQADRDRQASPATLVHQVIQTGRVAAIGPSPSERVSDLRSIAPGMPPLLSFRYYEGRLHHRFGNNDLVLDDAGH